MVDVAIQHLTRIVSGGQTGVDRAALDIAIELGIPHGGWCPHGRKAEDGIIDARYQLYETDSEDYAERTKLNIHDSDGTLILNAGGLSGGTALTVQFARQLNKPYLVIDMDETFDTESVYSWLNKNEIEILNIAGPREGKYQGIYLLTGQFLRALLTG